MNIRAAKPNRMIIIGLTGGIGMGKSTAAQILKTMGFPIYNADAEVHKLLKKDGKAVARVAKLFPETLHNYAIDRKMLGRAVFGKPRKLRRLEKILHPLVRQAEIAFVKNARKAKKRAVILEIPLLFETGGEKRCDITLCVTAPRVIQKSRVLSRLGMTEERFHAILKNQMPDAQKRKKADYIVPTGKGLAATEKHLHKILSGLSLIRKIA
jgi:dephospho-CoA kinase